jgi:hypothetical protein
LTNLIAEAEAARLPSTEQQAAEAARAKERCEMLRAVD